MHRRHALAQIIRALPHLWELRLHPRYVGQEAREVIGERKELVAQRRKVRTWTLAQISKVRKILLGCEVTVISRRERMDYGTVDQAIEVGAEVSYWVWQLAGVGYHSVRPALGDEGGCRGTTHLDRGKDSTSERRHGRARPGCPHVDCLEEKERRW